MSEHRDVAVEVTIAAPIEVVWRALRDREDVRRWHGWEDPTLEDEIEEIYFAGHDESQEQSEGPRRRLVRGPNVFELEQEGDGTRVRVVMAEPPEHDEWHGWYADIRHGWFTFVQQLRFYVERHRGEDRRTVILSGVPVDPAQPELPELLGLGTAPASLPTGETTGEVWFVDEHQVGVVVPEWGDGLLEVTRGRTPAGVILTLYGPDPAEVEPRWRTWWTKHFTV
jgi:uncharacterized protein YndB with AHSA1/START domain